MAACCQTSAVKKSKLFFWLTAWFKPRTALPMPRPISRALTKCLKLLHCNSVGKRKSSPDKVRRPPFALCFFRTLREFDAWIGPMVEESNGRKGCWRGWRILVFLTEIEIETDPFVNRLYSGPGGSMGWMDEQGDFIGWRIVVGLSSQMGR